jgi:hypothetical protein
VRAKTVDHNEEFEYVQQQTQNKKKLCPPLPFLNFVEKVIGEMKITLLKRS